MCMAQKQLGWAVPKAVPPHGADPSGTAEIGAARPALCAALRERGAARKACSHAAAGAEAWLRWCQAHMLQQLKRARWTAG